MVFHTLAPWHRMVIYRLLVLTASRLIAHFHFVIADKVYDNSDTKDTFQVKSAYLVKYGTQCILNSTS